MEYDSWKENNSHVIKSHISKIHITTKHSLKKCGIALKLMSALYNLTPTFWKTNLKKTNCDVIDKHNPCCELKFNLSHPQMLIEWY